MGRCREDDFGARRGDGLGEYGGGVGSGNWITHMIERGPLEEEGLRDIGGGDVGRIDRSRAWKTVEGYWRRDAGNWGRTWNAEKGLGR